MKRKFFVDGKSVDEKEIQKSALERYLSAENEKNKTFKDDELPMMMSRTSVIDENDSIAMERILGGNDLMPIAYLSKGFKVSKAVCKLSIKDETGQILCYGTGFMVSNEVLITNNHVISNIKNARYSVAEFNYQDDEYFMPCTSYYFRLDPDKFFITNKELDFTMVAVQNMQNKGKKLEDFGYLKLFPEKGKILKDEYVSIIQHPKGGRKSITLRENKVKYLLKDHIHYMTDTEPGSSGSPVFNDQWVVVALHHSGVPSPYAKGEWIANEGIRISSISNYIENLVPSMSREHQLVVQGIYPDFVVLEDPVVVTPVEVPEKKSGYDDFFLGSNYKIDLPSLSNEMLEDTTKMSDGQFILDYTHFSIVMCKSRGLAYFTAVNIDGNKKVHIKRGGDNWRFDSRIKEEFQYGNDVYKYNDLDRGHLVKRNDPNWGEYAHKANKDTFHYTNSAPQHKNLNQKIWLNLEDYILHNAYNHNLKISVFTGPVFKETDMVYREKYLIPEEFWKVVVMVKDNGEISATAYLQTQEDMLTNLEFFYGEYKTYQVPITTIEEKTGLDFNELSQYDPIANIEASSIVISDENSIRL